MTVYAKCLTDGMSRLFTKGQEYRVLEDRPTSFKIISNEGSGFWDLWESGCWQRIERQDTEGAEGQEHAYPPKDETDAASRASRYADAVMRDKFAMAALGMVETDGRYAQAPLIAKAAYAIADAMMAERAKQ